MGAKRAGAEVRKVTTVRMEPSEKELIEKEFGGLREAIDYLLIKIKKGVNRGKSKKAERKN